MKKFNSCELIYLYQIQNANALIQTIQPKKQQRQHLPLVSVTVLLMYLHILGMAIVMTAQIIWIATLMVEIAVAPMLTQTIAQVVKYAYTLRSLINVHF